MRIHVLAAARRPRFGQPWPTRCGRKVALTRDEQLVFDFQPERSDCSQCLRNVAEVSTRVAREEAETAARAVERLRELGAPLPASLRREQAAEGRAA